MIDAGEISKVYRKRGGPIQALDRVSLQISPKELVVVRGSSGSGKTTLLLLLGGLLRPTSGVVRADGLDLYRTTSARRARWRAERVGFVFQMFHLVPYLNVWDNVALSSLRGGRSTEIEPLLHRLGVWDRRRHKPSELSAGERQRVALARALSHKPQWILADEPTGNLDSENAAIVIRHLTEFRDAGGSVVVVTHDRAMDPWADRVILLNRGVMEEG